MPTISLCAECYLQGYCRNLRSRAVADAELTPAFIADVRHTMQALDLGQEEWEPFLTAAYRDYPGTIVDRDGKAVWLDTSVFDGENVRTWFRDLCRTLPANAKPRLKHNVRKRFAVLATILRARHPVRAALWGVAIANDNPGSMTPPALLAAQTGCPYADSRRIAARFECQLGSSARIT